jgi:two-component system nitrogen regulation sensor histidine kinase NtrY
LCNINVAKLQRIWDNKRRNPEFIRAESLYNLSDVNKETLQSVPVTKESRSGSNLLNAVTSTRELFDSSQTSRSRIIGLITVIALLITGSLTFGLLIGVTPIVPDQTMVLVAAAINGFLLLVLLFLIGKEIVKIIRSRRKGRAASRLHVRIISLFCLVAAFPAILVAIVAGITLDIGLDRWFELRTKKIIESSVSVARSYQNESTRVLMGNTLSMGASLDRNRRLYILDRERFIQLLTIEAQGRGLLAASLVREDGSELMKSDIETTIEIPDIPAIALELAKAGNPVPIPPVDNNLVGAVLKLNEIPNAYLYTIIAIPPAVIEAVRNTELNSSEYNALEQNRLPFQLAFAILYLGVCLIVLLSAMWMGISVATRIVTPIRRLMTAAQEVSQGNLDVRVDSTQSEGDLQFLNETFNEMLGDLKTQQSDLVEAKELMDQRARFIEAVLSGVNAGVIGLDASGKITIANKQAFPILGFEGVEGLVGKPSLEERAPELNEVFKTAVASGNPQHHEQITLIQEGRERTLNVQVTLEQEEKTQTHSFVMTLDDITDLVSAQRNTAWADVARRIAHEIKNPLTPIQLSAERIKRRYGKHITEDREVFDNCTDTIIRQVGDIGKMVDEFSAFARMPVPQMSKENIKKTIRETVFLQKVGFPDIEFTMEAEKQPLFTVYDSRMLSQALINVLKNAAEAIEAFPGDDDYKGKIVVRVKEEAQKIFIDIIDNGKGLPEKNRQRLLEPYMTTREKGTGLGLAIVRKIAEDHGGTIELMDAPDVANGGHGAMMRFTLPVVEAHEERDAHEDENSLKDENKSEERV